MTSEDLDKSLVSICNQLIKRISGKIASSSFGNISGTRSLTQLLWYARPSYVGFLPELLFLWVSKSAVSDMTTDDLNEALVAIRNQLNKHYGGKSCVVKKYFWPLIFYATIYRPQPLKGRVDWFCFSSCFLSARTTDFSFSEGAKTEILLKFQFLLPLININFVVRRDRK